MVLRKASVGALPRLNLPPLAIGEDSFAFKDGDFVKISGDEENVRKLQTGHGEWVDSMAQVHFTDFLSQGGGARVQCNM